MGHTAETYVFLKALGHELRPIVRDDSRPRCGKLFPRPLENHLHIRLSHRFPNLPVDHVAAVSIQHTAQVVERATDVDVSDVDVPVLMRFLRLMEPFSLPNTFAKIGLS